MPTIRVHIKVSAATPVAESLGGTFLLTASGCVDVYRILRDRIREMSPSGVATDDPKDLED